MLLESKFGQILRALNLRAFWVRPLCPRVGRGRGGAPPQLLWPSGRASAGGPGLVSSCARVFFVAPSLFRAAATSTSGNQERAAAFRHHYRSLSIFAVKTLLALRSAELPSWRGVAAKRELRNNKPLGLLHEALLSGRSFLRTETRSYSLPLQRIACRLPICLVRCSPIFAVRHLLRRSRCARCVRFVELRWCGS